MQGSQTLGKTKKPKTSGQRLSAGNIEVGELSRENSHDADEPPPDDGEPFRHRSKTLGDTVGEILKALCQTNLFEICRAYVKDIEQFVWDFCKMSPLIVTCNTKSYR